MVPGPSKAVLLLFPITDAIEQKCKEEDERLEKEKQPNVDPTLIYIKQTVSSGGGIRHPFLRN
jgi:ubiquitin carboxyl-terminal hydrolase L3